MRRRWIGRAKLLVALLQTFLSGHPCSLPLNPPLALPHSWFSIMVCDQAVLRAMKMSMLHEWTNVEFHTICKKHGLNVRGAKGDLMGRVAMHFQQVWHVQGLSTAPLAMEHFGGETLWLFI